MLDKKVTRKEFLLGALSITALFVASKVPSVVKNQFSQPKGNNTFGKAKIGNAYGNYSYGGGKKNA